MPFVCAELIPATNKRDVQTAPKLVCFINQFTSILRFLGRSGELRLQPRRRAGPQMKTVGATRSKFHIPRRICKCASALSPSPVFSTAKGHGVDMAAAVSEDQVEGVFSLFAHRQTKG